MIDATIPGRDERQVHMAARVARLDDVLRGTCAPGMTSVSQVNARPSSTAVTTHGVPRVPLMVTFARLPRRNGRSRRAA